VTQGIFEALDMAGKRITGVANDWLDVNAEAGFVVGWLQNQTGYTIEAIQSDVKPGKEEKGRWIYSGLEAQIDSASSKLWIRSAQPISAYVQESS
jgi:hypothetical protein